MMLPALSSTLENGQSGKLLAVLEEWGKASDQHTDNTKKFFILLLVKFGLETVVLYSYSPKRYIYFLNVFGLSVVLADFFLAFLMGAAWFLGTEKSLASPCFLLANASTAYGALPLPTMLLGLIDYSLEDILMSSAFLKTLRNVILTLAVWVIVINYSFHFDYVGPVELESMTEKKVLVCEVTESRLISAFILGLFTVTLLTLVPFWSRAPLWVREVSKPLEAREQQRDSGSYLFLVSTWNPKPVTNTRFKEHLEQNRLMSLSLWSSKLLRFLFFWTPYLVMSVSCLIFGFGLPAYLGFNLLWFECSNTLLVGLVFWAKSNTKSPYSSLPENVYLWQVYWD